MVYGFSCYYKNQILGGIMRKNLFRTVLCLALVFIMAFGLTACKSNTDTTETTLYTVTFDVQGHGTAPKTQAVEVNGKATEPTAPSAEGWFFGGWYEEKACSNSYNFNKTVTESITLYAKWTATDKQYQVTFDVKGHGTAPRPQLVDEGGKAAEPIAPKAAGQKFGGWYDQSGTVKYDFDTPVTANITLYASWTAVQIETDKTPTIYLAGDSTVQTYQENQYIAGWGQYLGLFLDGDVKVVNAAKGGRSSRSFINEGRLFKGEKDEYKYSFSENGSKSIEETIEAGDFLFIQFGHNDDDTKGYSTMPDRMVPLGTKDSKGIYPVTAPTGKQPTTYLPKAYTDQETSTTTISSMLQELAKYGDNYYAYDCGGTYKWFLKQYIDLARDNDATPVLVTPVARVKFDSNGNIVGGPGLHGDDFAYVQAVRQLAEEENCLLIDLFAETKRILEVATSEYSDFLMAIVPNAATGVWPTDYDNLYGNTVAGFEKIEATHYNKYGAYLTAAKLVENILGSVEKLETMGADGEEYFNFADHIITTPSAYVNPSNRISKTKIAAMEALFDKVNPTDPDRQYPDPAEVKAAITTLVTTEVTAANYEAQVSAYEAVLALYNKLNVDDKGSVDNYADLIAYSADLLNAKIAVLLTGTVDGENYKTYETLCKQLRAEYEALSQTLQAKVTNVTILVQYETDVKNNKPKPTKTVVLNASDITSAQVTSSAAVDGITFSFTGLTLNQNYKAKAFEYNGNSYAATTQNLYFSGGANLTSANPGKYLEFTTDKQFNITIVAGSTGTDRTILMVDSNKTEAGKFNAVKEPQAITTVENVAAGTYRLGSAGSAVCIYYIIIEFYS